MANPYFRFKEFTVYHNQCAMKVTTDGCLFGAWCAAELQRVQHEGTTETMTVLDIGTGTGLLSLMVGQKVAASIQAVEIDANAAAQAESNVAASSFKDSITILQQNIVELAGTSYDVIVSNPPFYEQELHSGSEARDTAHHSHQLTWKELFAAVNRLLKQDGLFYLLLPYKRMAELNSYVGNEGLFLNKLVTVAPSVTHNPFRLLVQGSRIETIVATEHLDIKDTNQQYTPEFTALLKDYYLYL